MSSSLTLHPRRRSYVRLIGEIQHALNHALCEEHQIRGLTKAQIAAVIGKDKSFVTRKLSGTGNMTLETLADLAYALNRPVKVVLPSRTAPSNSNSVRKNPPKPEASNNLVIRGPDPQTPMPSSSRRVDTLEDV